MAIPQSKNNNGKSQPSSGARFRQRKISVKQLLLIYRLKDLPSVDLVNELEPSQVHHLSNQQQNIHSFETGIDKNEEDEIHLQQVINAAQKALLKDDTDKSKEKDTSVYIPTPDASRIWPEASQYYNDNDFIEPESYIKYSAVVEDAVGVEYNIDEIDEEFLNQKLNKPTNSEVKDESKKEICSELEFEIVCDKFERLIEEKQPFLSMDYNNILSFKELSSFILEEFNSSHKNNPYIQVGANLKYMTATTLKERLSKELKFDPFVTFFDKKPLESNHKNSPRSIAKLLDLFGEKIYNHWKERKIERKGKPISPALKFEDPNANEKDNDNDPYVCFRRREFRQARKTRRADNLGIEKIRLLQRSLHRARDIMLNVSQREILKLENWKSERKVFKLRCEAKNVKRIANIQGDDHLFYPYKRRKIVKIKDEEEEKEKERDAVRTKRERKNKAERDHNLPPNANRDRQITPSINQDNASSSTQPYVKLPPSKIPDMDLVTVSLVLREKNETIKRAVHEKLKKRRENDKGFINLTDDPYQPYFDVSSNKTLKDKELNHIPYSSIAATNLHQINTTNYINDALRKVLAEGKAPLPGTRTFKGSSGDLIPSEPFPHLQTLLQGQLESKKASNGYIARLLRSIDANDYGVYVNGFGDNSIDDEEKENNISEPIFRLRRRVGRYNTKFVDRRVSQKHDVVDEFLTFNGDEANNNNEDEDEDEESMQVDKISDVSNVYDSKVDILNRYKSNWKFDNETEQYSSNLEHPFSLDPSRLNSISDDTQSIRFASMLLSKSYDLLRDSVHQRQQTYIQQARMRAAIQQQQMRKANLADQNRSKTNTTNTNTNSTTSGSTSNNANSSSNSNTNTNPNTNTNSNSNSNSNITSKADNLSSGSNSRSNQSPNSSRPVPTKK